MKLINRASLAMLILGFALILTRVTKAAHPPVDLGTAESFAVLAGTPNITDTGNSSTITGDVGLSPATSAGMDDIWCANVDGTIYGVDAAYTGSGDTSCFVNNAPLMTTAKSDLTAAFIDAAGRTPATTVPTELGGTTLTDGTYDSTSTTFGITAGAGPLVLDGEGDPNAVFIFQMGFAGTGLTVGPGSEIQLINEAQACNVFWQLDTATINTTAVFKGTIMALNSITVANGADIEGRLLARNGSVTLINDTIYVPVCAAPSEEEEGGGGGAGGDTPGLPNAGVDPSATTNNIPWLIIVPAGLSFVITSALVARKKWAYEKS